MLADKTRLLKNGAPLLYVYINTQKRNSLPAHHMREGSIFIITVVSPRFELGQAEPKPAVLPLHHETILNLLNTVQK
jgi:hypothetical protein